MRKSNYDKYPSTAVNGSVRVGWKSIAKELVCGLEYNLAVDCYTGVLEDEVIDALRPHFSAIVHTNDLMKSESQVRSMTERFMTNHVLCGYVANTSLEDFFDKKKLAAARSQLEGGKRTLIIGVGAALVAEDKDRLVYADMARWEIQQRFRRHLVRGIGVDNRTDAVSVQYKRGYFIDWRTLDAYKERLFSKVEWWLDTNDASTPKLISGETFRAGMAKTARKPFRVVPFFDPAPWGGQWMKDVCDLDRSEANYGWCFDCVPEENSLLLEVDGVKVEFPANDLVMTHSRELLGVPVEGRFGKDFPIRFDFLDTIGGGNLSLQVHPTADYIRKTFGMSYTQDESYYIMDAGEGASVYLGFKTGADKDEMLADLRAAERGEKSFDAEKYVNRIPARKHDHFLIPGGTLHCSGAEAMVLEISATPNLFTFKLWDWGRMGLDGKPRPINVEHGSHVIQWERNTEYVHANLVDHFEPTVKGEGWSEIKTGLHPAEFIETRRTSFAGTVPFETRDSVQVLNLVEGEEAVVESPDGSFEPFVVHYAETFIIPACVGRFTICPYGESEGKECMVIRAYVRFNG
jgi:mannose-6-phosphate isomerase class I